VVHIKEIVGGLRGHGYSIGLVASSLNKAKEVSHFYNLNIIPSFMLRFFRLKKQPHVASLIFLFLYLLRILPQYNIIYARDYHTVLAAIFPRLLFKKRLVYEVNGIASEEQRLKSHSFLNRILICLIQRAEKMAARCSDRIVSVTPEIGFYLTTNFQCQPNKIDIIGNGVNLSKFHPLLDEALLWQWKEKLGIGREEIVVAFVGNLARWQGVNLLIESGILLLSRGEKLKFLLVGDGPLKGDLVRRVSGSGFEKEFVFTGMVDYDDVPFLINLADICAAPFILRRNQITGVSPIKVFEYMACGKPVIASRIGGLEFIEEEGVGLLINPEDTLSLEQILYDLIKNPQKRKDMGNRGHEITRERFSWESRVTQIEEIFKKMA
jgi:glycosyltransferase involved in cell wall biosynthesis